MSDPRSASMTRGGSTLLVALNLLIAFALIAVSALFVVFPCANDVCLAGAVVGPVAGLIIAVLMSLAVRYLWGRSSVVAVVDAALAAVIVGLSSRTILQLDISGMLVIGLFLAAPLVAALLATQEAAHGLERVFQLVALVLLAGVLVLQPEVRLGASVPLLVALALAFPRPRPLPYGAEPEGSATVGHSGDRAE